jgi:hypothetical protein
VDVIASAKPASALEDPLLGPILKQIIASGKKLTSYDVEFEAQGQIPGMPMPGAAGAGQGQGQAGTLSLQGRVVRAEGKGKLSIKTSVNMPGLPAAPAPVPGQGAAPPPGKIEVETLLATEGKQVTLYMPAAKMAMKLPASSDGQLGMALVGGDENKILGGLIDTEAMEWRYVGSDSVNGRKCEVIEGTSAAPAMTERLWIDPARGYGLASAKFEMASPVGMGMASAAGGGVTMGLDVKDSTETQPGIWMPTSVSLTIGGADATASQTMQMAFDARLKVNSVNTAITSEALALQIPPDVPVQDMTAMMGGAAGAAGAMGPLGGLGILSGGGAGAMGLPGMTPGAPAPVPMGSPQAAPALPQANIGPGTTPAAPPQATPPAPAR